MSKYYFTFGQFTPLGDYVVVINGEYLEAREKMVSVFGTKWSSQYNEEQWSEFVKKYGEMTEIVFKESKNE